MQINPSRRGGSGGETGEREEVGSDEKEKEFHKVEDNVNEELRKNKEEDGLHSLEDFLLESFEIDELPQSDYNTLGLIRPEKVNSMSHLNSDYSVFQIHSLRVWKR